MSKRDILYVYGCRNMNRLNMLDIIAKMYHRYNTIKKDFCEVLEQLIAEKLEKRNGK